MKNLVKGLASLILIAALVMGISVISHAEEISYKCGKDATWSYDATSKILTISGEGSIYYNDAWDDIKPEKVVIKSGITKISYDTFYGMKSIKKVSIPDTVTKIGSWAFGHTGITAFEMPDSVKKVSGGAFSNCKKLEKLTFSKSVETIPGYVANNTPKLKNVVIKEGTKKIGKEAFYGCGAIEIQLPSTITTIGRLAFNNAKNLKSIKIPEKVTKIRDNTFEGCTSLGSVEFIGKIKTIGECAFKDCESLKEITIPGSVNAIEYKAFENAGCEKVTIEDGVEEIDYWAFSNCDKLATISIGIPLEQSVKMLLQIAAV